MRRIIAALAAALVLSGTAVALPPPTPAAAALPAFHIVRPGETLRGVAQAYGLRWRVVAAWNGLRYPYRVYPDTVLRFTRPAVALPAFRTGVQTVTPAEVGWNPAKRCPVPPADLRRIWVSYIDFAGNYHDGSIIMHRLHVARTQAVFRSLYYRRFRIWAMSPVSVNFPGMTDMASVTSGYQCRFVAGTTTVSQHSYGNTIDINPVQNPMIRNGVVTPANGAGYVRRGYRRGVLHGVGAVNAFTNNGFHWGGRWNSLKDYMHFSTTNR